MTRLIALLLALVALAAPATAREPESRFAGWASAIVAADWRTSAGAPIEAFDNSRRDLTAAFLRAGFAREDMVDFTLRPDVANPVSSDHVLNAISEVTAKATKGCFLYFTSHGSPQGIVFGPSDGISPQRMASLIDGWCGTRPTVVVISACYSGVFVPVLEKSNRMIITAARRDRSSFGCSEDAVYPYFDGCILESLETARTFLTLASAAKACVARRETEENLRPASEPQSALGGEMMMLLPTLRFNAPGG